MKAKTELKAGHCRNARNSNNNFLVVQANIASPGAVNQNGNQNEADT